MKPINPVRSVLQNCWALLGHYKSRDAFSAIKFHVKNAVICYLTHKKEELQSASYSEKDLLKCDICGILWKGRKKVEKKIDKVY